MADNFNFKQFLMENKLGAYSKGKAPEIDPHDPYGTGPMPGGMFEEDEEAPEEDSRWLPKGAPGDTFRSRYSQQDAEYRKQKALDAVEYPKSGLQFKTFTALYNYADKAGVDLHALAKQSPTVDSFIEATASKVKGFNSPKIVSVLKKYYSDIKK